MKEDGVACSPRHAHHITDAAVLIKQCPMAAAAHGLGEEIRTIKLLGVFEEVAVICQV